MGWIKPKTVSSYCPFKYLLVGQTVKNCTVSISVGLMPTNLPGQVKHGTDQISCAFVLSSVSAEHMGGGGGGRLLHTMHAMCRTPPPSPPPHQLQ
jgi:hypothetical protein